MQISDLSIAAFRGLRDPVHLKLDARLTVLYSPNGTGKTSICDAVEWLLTGEVSRLHKLKTSDAEGVGNIFTLHPPQVEACLGLINGFKRFRRSGTGNNARFESEQNGVWQSSSLDAILEGITPDNLPRVRVRQPHVSRANWLRAVRFLAPASLDLLIDNSSDAQEVRSLVCSQLFGVEELQEHETHLRKVLAELPKPLELKRKREAIAAQMLALVDSSTSTASQDALRQMVPVLERIVLAAKLLNVAHPEGSADAAQQVAMIEAEGAKALVENAERRTALDTARRGWPRYCQLVARESVMQKEIGNLTARLETLRAEVTKIARSHDAALSEAIAAEKQAAGFSEDTFRDLLSQFDSLLAQWDDLAALKQSVFDPNELRDGLRQAEQNLDKAKLHGELVEQCLSAIPDWREASAQIEAANKRLSELEPPAPELIQAIPQQIGELRESLERFDRETARFAGPLERLQSIAVDLLDNFPPGCRCPLCNHEHPSADVLRTEVQRSISERPIILRAREDDRRKMADALVAMEAKHQRWAKSIAEIHSLKRIVEELQKVLSSVPGKLIEAGLPGLAFGQDTEERLKSAKSETCDSLAKRKIEVENRRSLARASDALAQWRERSEAAVSQLQMRTNSDCCHAGLENLPLSDWRARLKEWLHDIQELRQVVLKKAIERRAAASEHTRMLTGFREQVQTLERELAERLKEIGNCNADRRALDDIWSQIAPGQQWTPEALEEAQKRLAQHSENLSAAQAQIAGARAAQAANSEVAEQTRKSLERQHLMQEKQSELRKIKAVEQLREDLKKAADQIKESRETYVIEQIQPLTEVIQSLYRRAQSNALIDGVSMERKRGAMHWLAQAGGKEFEDPVQLSQGQRQDLALSIFLARARGVGGTFFLDEPLSHLDDLNRVALLDIFRVIAVEQTGVPLNIVLTTASTSLVRHFREKFSLVRSAVGETLLRIYQLTGDPRNGVKIVEAS